VVTAYKNLKYVERDFRHIKADGLDLRPVFHYLEGRVKAHVLICMLAGRAALAAASAACWSTWPP
jgi:transposase